MGLLGLAITLALAIFVKRQWPGLAWLAISSLLDVGGWALLTSDDPRRATMIPHMIITLLLYAVARGVRRFKEEYDGKVWLVAGWQLGSVATFVFLTFLNGYVYNWWNWIIVIPINGFLAEIWPIYWAILRPIFG